MSPQDFTAIKQKIESSPILSVKERQEWLGLLPRMSETETKELDRILSVRLPHPPSLPPSPGSQKSQMTFLSGPPRPSTGVPSPARGEGNKVDALDHPHRSFLRHLREHKNDASDGLRQGRAYRDPSLASRETIPAMPPKTIVRQPSAIPAIPPRPELNYLSSLTVADLRRPPSIYVSLENLHKQIETTIAGKVAAPTDIVAAFEKSPLYRDYLATGVAIINNRPAPLTHEELEALTDFRIATF